MPADPPPEPRPATTGGWLASRLLFALLFLLATLALGYMLWTGYGPGEGRGLVSFREDPDAMGPVVGLGVFWLFGLGYLLQQLRIWQRREHGPRGAQQFRRALTHRERQGSRVGNAIAWIIAIPLALVVLLTFFVMVFP